MLLQLIDVGRDESRVQRCELPALLDYLAFTDVDAPDDRWIERLQHERRVHRDDLSAGAGDNPIHARKRQDHSADEKPQRQRQELWHGR